MDNAEEVMRIHNGMIDDDERDNVVQLTPEDVVVQSMLLFKLNVVQYGNRSPKDSVLLMIDEYNSKISNTRERYMLLTEFSDEFVDVFEQTKRKERTTALYHAIKKNDHKMTNYITVYYAQGGNVYAQTSGNAWHVVSANSDLTFPVKISERLLDDNGRKSHANIPLSGNMVFQQKRCKKPERSYECGAQNVTVRFTAALRPDASIRAPDLNCFPNSNRKIMVKVGAKFIQFDCDIKKDGMRNFINHLNEIYNGKVTYTTHGYEEKNTDAFVESLRMADDNEKEILDNILKGHMKSYIQLKDGFNEHLSGLDLCQRDILTFLNADNFKICIKRKKIEVNQTPTLVQTLDIIRRNTSTTTLSGRTANDNDSNFFDQIKISFDQHNRCLTRPLFNLIEGTMMYDGQMFYRINRKWYYMSEDHIQQIHIKFRKFLRERLITDQAMGLEERWTFGAPEGTYNDLYMRRPDFLVGDDCSYGTVELFDLLRYDERTQQAYLYYVKKNLSGEVRTLAFQVMTATDIFENCFTWNEHVLANLQSFYASIVRKYEKKRLNVPQCFDSFEKLRNMLSRRNRVTIICAVFDTNPVPNTIFKERDAVDCFVEQDIYNAYLRLSHQDKSVIHGFFYSYPPRQICGMVFKKLIEMGYVKASDGNGCSTAKLLLAHQNPKRADDSDYFRLYGPQDEQVDAIIWKLIRQFSSFFKSTSAKYSLMNMHTNGFDFKICQIQRF